MVAAGISVSELLVLKLFIGIVVREDAIARSEFIALGAGILIFFLLTRVGQYFQRTYRVKAFGRAFKGLKKLRNKGARNSEWAMAFELTSLLTNATQLIAILLFMFILEPEFALFNSVILIIVLTAIAMIFSRHIALQEQLHVERAGRKARPQRRYGERIKAAESGGLASAAGMLILLGALLFLSYQGEISVSNTLILFFGARLQNAALTSGSRSLMRYAKAKVGRSIDGEEDE